MPLNTRIDVNRPSPFTIRNHAFGARPSTSGGVRTKPQAQGGQPRSVQDVSKPA
jgi:hypothetical protein